RQDLAVLALAGPDGDHLTLLGLLLRGVGNDDASLALLLLLLESLDDHAVAQGPNTRCHDQKPPPWWAPMGGARRRRQNGNSPDRPGRGRKLNRPTAQSRGPGQEIRWRLRRGPDPTPMRSSTGRRRGPICSAISPRTPDRRAAASIVRAAQRVSKSKGCPDPLPSSQSRVSCQTSG